MLGRWWPWGRRKTNPTEQRAPEEVRPAQLAVPVEGASKASRSAGGFFETLALAQPEVEPFGAEGEARISELVLRIVDHLSHKRVEPPVMPALVPRVLAIVNEPDVDIVRLAQLIEQDLALGTKLLSVANSPAFGGNVEIKSVRKAIGHLGTEQVAQVAIGLACASSFVPGNGGDAALRTRWGRLFEHGMTTACAAAGFVARRDESQQSAVFLAGLFHDVGKAVALRALEALLAGKLEALDGPIVDEALYRVHAFPGEEFTKRWTLPEALMAVCTQHHQLEDVPEPPPALYYVSLASSFDVLIRGEIVERARALSEARVAAHALALSDLELTTAYAQTDALGSRSGRMFAT